MALTPGSIIKRDEFLAVDDYIQSSNRLFFAIMQADGNFCVYRGTGPDDMHGCLWASMKLAGGGKFFAIMQGDGNFCVYPKSSPSEYQGQLSGALWCAKSNKGPGEYFAIIQDDGNFCVYRGTGPDDNHGHMWNTETTDPVADYEIESIDYDVDAAKILSSSPAVLFSQRVKNDSQSPQTSTISGSEKITETSSWSNSLGIKVGVKTEFKCGVPLLAEGKVEVSLEVENTYTWGKEVARENGFSFSTPLTVLPGEEGYVLVEATKSEIAVPYTLAGTMIFKSGTRMPGQIEGTYQGINSHDLTVNFQSLVPDTLEQMEMKPKKLEATITFDTAK